MALDSGTPPEVTSTLSAAQVRIGEPFVVSLDVVHDPALRCEVRPQSGSADFEVLSQERLREDVGATSTTHFKLTLSAFKLGKLTVPAFPIEATDGTATMVLPSQPLPISVASSLPPDAGTEGAKLLDVRPPEQVLVRTYRLLWILLGLAALAAALVWYRRFRKRDRPVIAAPPATIAVRTLEALDALAKQDLPRQARFQEYYFRLSEVLRSYLGERFGFDALESTTPELLAHLTSRSTPGLAVKDLSSFATLSDFVRYAKSQPSAGDAKDHLDLAYRIVRETTPVTPGTPTNNAGS